MCVSGSGKTLEEIATRLVMSGAPGGSVTARIASELVRTSSPSRSETRGSEPASLRARQQPVGAERAGGDDDAARGVHPAVPAQPGAGALARDRVAVRAVGRAERPDVDDRALGHDLRPRPLGQPEVVLRQRVLGVVGTADHAAPARDAARPRRTGAAEEGIGRGLPRLAEVDADARLGVGAVGADLAPELAQQEVGGIVGVDGDDAEHPLRRVEVRRQRGIPVVQPGPLRVGVEALGRAVEGVGVTQRPAADAAARSDRDVAEDRQAEDALEAELRRPEVAPQVPCGARQLVIGEAAAALEQPHAVPLLGQPQRGDAAAEAGADHQPVMLEILTHRQDRVEVKMTGASGSTPPSSAISASGASSSS